MEATAAAETVAALWFTVVFGLALLVPAFRAPCKAARKAQDKREERKQ